MLDGTTGLGVQMFAIGVATGLATLAGGAMALRLRANMGLLAGFGGGVVIGVALMGLLPEALGLAHPGRPLTVTAMMAAGFMIYVLINRLSDQLGQRSQRLARHLAPASLVFHSLMDGLGIGVAFNVSTAAGLVVALAVLSHDLLDGANIVTLTLAGELSPKIARRWLALDALAPLVGIGLSLTIRTSPQTLSVLLALFAGLFLHIGAMELLPRSRAGSTGLVGATAAALGAAFILAIVQGGGG